MKRLKEFPSLMLAFNDINMDSGGSMHRRINGEAAVEGGWERGFKVAEAVLARLEGKTIGEVAPEAIEEQYRDDVKLTDSAFETVVLGPDGIPDRILAQIGATEAEIFVVNHVLYEFFDGELWEPMTLPKWL